jgi:hypothetical protein
VSTYFPTPIDDSNILDSLEIYFKDSRSLLCVFATKLDRHAVLSKLERFVSEIAADGRVSALYRQPLLSLVSFTGKNSHSRSDIDSAQRRWQAREISNVGVQFVCLIPCCLPCFFF